jgi:acetoacetyl-CoA synthetase
MGEPRLWTPDPARARASAMARFAARVNLPLPEPDHGGEPAALRRGWERLHRWSIEHRAAFWSELWDFLGVRGEKGRRPLENGDAMPGARWFPDARLNFAENLLAGAPAPDALALIFVREDGLRRTHTFAELAREAAAIQCALKEVGVREGACVAAFLPNSPEAVAGMLAAAGLGAIWSSCSPDFGVAGVLDRFGQIAPKVLIACDGYMWKGERLDVREKVGGILAGLPSVCRTIFVPYADPAAEFPAALRWPDLVARHSGARLETKPLPFAQPLFVMYTSGTTGQPKCIVHGHGGTLLQHRKEHVLHLDLQPGERLSYFTTTGWMMWNWLVSGLASGATCVLLDGNPFHPTPDALWQVARREKVNLFGVSAKWVDACKKAGALPGAQPSIRTLISTGSPLVPESFDWIAQNLPGRAIVSISGGTDLISSFVLGNPLLPVHRGEIQGPGLGQSVEVWNEEGKPVIGEAGEQVCTQPFPSMPVGFWNDPGDVKYRAAYFEHFPNVWRHGDWATHTERGGFIVHGRSDATLNPGGVRIGTAEIYRQVEQIPEVEESLVIGQKTGDGDERVVLFVKLRGGAALDAELLQRIRARLRDHASPRHVPAVIAAVTDIPRTRSGKISEIAVREVVHERLVKNTEALANPEALEQFRARLELRLF